MRTWRANWHHTRALQVLVATLALDIALGILIAVADHVPLWHGVYCAIGTATTVGCDIAPKSGYSYAIFALMMLTIVPLFTAIFSFFTSGLTADHIEGTTEKQTKHVETLTDRQTTELKEHISNGHGR